MDKGLWVRAATGHSGAIERVLGRKGRDNGEGIACTFENKIHTALDPILYIVHTLLVTTYIIPSPTTV